MRNILKHILTAGLALSFFALPQASFADCCDSNSASSIDVQGFPADFIFQQVINNRIFQVRTETVALFEIQATLLHNALGLPATQQVLTDLTALLQLNSTALANLIVSFNPSQAGNVANLAALFFQFDQQVIAFAQNPVGLQGTIIPQLEFTVVQIANLIAQILPGINSLSLIVGYNFYIAGLVSQVNFFSTQQAIPGVQAEIATRIAVGAIGTYVAVGELIQEWGVKRLTEQFAN